MKRKLLFPVLFLVLISSTAQSQERLFQLNKGMQQWVDPYIYQPELNFHPSVKPFQISELREKTPFDSILNPQRPAGGFYDSWVGRKIFKEDLVKFEAGDFMLRINPLFHFQIGRDLENEDNAYTNTRGFHIEGTIGPKVSFYTGFFENQASFVNYIDSVVVRQGIVPGQGRIKFFKENAYDYSMSFGGVIYRPSKHFAFQFAHDKNFIGDGYRSLLLSDVAYNYPFLKITTDVWKIKYINIFAQFQDLKTPVTHNTAFRKKYGTFHYLDVNIGKKLKIGLFDAIIWANDTANGRGFDMNYLNPVIFLRPVEFSLNSPDNAMIGMNVSFAFSRNHILYGQLALDEFLLKEVKDGNGWHGNKQAFQVGYKGFNLGIKNLGFQTEFNYVRPFMYQHLSTLQNYGHFNEALAHPLGANFYESVSFLTYRYRRIHLSAQVMYAVSGRDTATFNYGNNIFKNYQNRPSEYGNEHLQGLQTTTMFTDLKLSYLINPKTNMNVELGVINRNLTNDLYEQNTMWVYFGFRTAIYNYYYDF
ncbi:MAG: hypothetical protein ACR2GN_00635 [Bacteroidia bacterium]